MASGSTSMAKSRRFRATAHWRALRRSIRSTRYCRVSSATMRAAQKEPEKYANLQIRLCGWNVRFIDLRKDMQECLIREAEWKEA